MSDLVAFAATFGANDTVRKLYEEFQVDLSADNADRQLEVVAEILAKLILLEILKLKI